MITMAWAASMPDPTLEANAADVAALLISAYGLEGRIAKLGGERGPNFLVTAVDGQRYVLKTIAAADEADLQARLLLHLARTDPSLAIPRLQLTRHGRATHDWRTSAGGSFSVLLLSFLDGPFLNPMKLGEEALREVGRMFGRLDRALSGFSHPAAARPLIWDLCRAHEVRSLLAGIADSRGRSLAAWGLDLFRDMALPRLASLRRQIIHADPNPHNILFHGGKVRGIIDFGDAIEAPVANEPAIAAAYHLRRSGRSPAGALALLSGYHSINPLRGEEIDLLFPLMAGRLAATLAITAFNAAREPDNAAYILKNAGIAMAGLAMLHAVGFTSGRAYFHAALTSVKPE